MSSFSNVFVWYAGHVMPDCDEARGHGMSRIERVAVMTCHALRTEQEQSWTWHAIEMRDELGATWTWHVTRIRMRLVTRSTWHDRLSSLVEQSEATL